MSREFGIYPDNCAPRQWWGARALIENGRMVILPDRQNYERDDTLSDEDKHDMFGCMQNTMDAALKSWIKKTRPYDWVDIFEMDSESGRFHCMATPMGSYGSYLYIGVWEV